MSQTLSEQTIALVKATVPALEAHGLEIVQVMYTQMFKDPAIRDLFNQSHQGGADAGSQPRALAGAILAYAANIENLGALTQTVERIAQKHVGLQIAPEHYPHVAEALLGAIKAVLGEAATPEILNAWAEAYWFLANILIGRERDLYQEQATTDGGWNGWRDFRIAEVIRESSVIKSFVLRPVDGGRRGGDRPVGRHRGWRQPATTPSSRPIRVKASIARSTCSRVCAALICVRIRACPLGTTGKKKPIA